MSPHSVLKTAATFGALAIASSFSSPSAGAAISSLGGPAPSCPAGTANVGVLAERRVCQISGTIVGNLVLASLPGVVYSLSGRVNVGTDRGPDPLNPLPGSQQGILTIEPGVVVFGSSTADFLVVHRGSQIFAEGTAAAPIIFTSRSNIEGTLGPDSIGEWGGILVLGRAPIHSCIGGSATPGTVNCQSAAEGTTNAFYGGGSATDNSGRLAYLQVRFPGFEVAPGNELNGITFAGVGSATFARYLQVHNSSDDGIEWFGGRVNHKHLVITGADDDSIDTDLGYKGLLQYVLVIQRSTGGDRVIEAETSGFELRTPRSNPRIANFTFINRRVADGVLLRGGTDFGLVNGIIAKTNTFPGLICLDIDGAQTVAAANALADEAGPPLFRSVLFGCATAARDEADVPSNQIFPLIFGNGNRLPPLTLSLIDGFLPGPTETAAAATNPRTAFSGTGTFFDETTYVGAFRDTAESWHVGWTCGLGGSSLPCNVSPFAGLQIFANGFE